MADSCSPSAKFTTTWIKQLSGKAELPIIHSKSDHPLYQYQMIIHQNK